MKKCLFTTVFILGMTVFSYRNTYADMNLEADSALSGISVAFNNYYARTMSPEEALAQSVELVGKGTIKIRMEDASAVRQLVKEEEERKVELISPEAYENIAISRVEDSVAVRSGTEDTSDIVGRIYNNSAAEILDTLDVSGKTWYKIRSGNVSGYIEAEYFVTGDHARDVAKEIATIYGTVENTKNLRLRAEPSRESTTLTLLAEDSTYIVLGEEGDFLKVQVDDDLTGYVFKDYVRTEIKFGKALSIEDEKRIEEEKEKRKKEAESAIAKLESVKRQEEGNKAKESDSDSDKKTSKASSQESFAPSSSETSKPVSTSKEAVKQTGASKTEVKEKKTTSLSETGETVVAKTQNKESTVETTASGTKATKKQNAETVERLAQSSSIVPAEIDDILIVESPDRKESTAKIVKESVSKKAEVEEKGTEVSVENKESTKQETEVKAVKNKNSSNIGAATRDAVVAYAKQFVGNPYVYGGTSLTQGADCSGFTLQVYAHFGYSIGRTSRDQALKGETVSEAEARPGDLVFYASDSYINHVAIYIGNGKVVHASNERTGIIISSMNYRTPVKITNILD